MIDARSNAVLALAVVAAVGLVAAAASRQQPRSVCSAIPARAPDAAGEIALRIEPADERRAPELAGEVQPCAAPAASSHEAVAAAVGALASSLAGARCERWSWDAELAATAASMAGDRVGPLSAILRDPTRPAVERVAAAELLHVLGAPPATLDGDAWDCLHSTWLRLDDTRALAAAAARALCRLGSDADRDEFAGVLVASPSAEQRRIAAWALGDAPNASLVNRLAELDVDGAELALALIERWNEAGRHTTGASVVIASIASDAARPVRLRERALAALDAPEIEALAGELAQLVRESSTPPTLTNAACRALARGDEARGNHELAALATDARLPLERRVSAAEALGHVDDSLATAVLTGALDAPPDAGDAHVRRRACAALAGRTSSNPTLERVAASDPDSRVRAAAQLALAPRSSPKRE